MTNDIKLTLTIGKDEVWWGGAAANGPYPLTNESEYHEDMIHCNTSDSNESMPLFVSSRGRYVWSDTPFDIRVSNGTMELRGGDPVLCTAGDCLKDAYQAAQRAHFPTDGRKLEDLFFTAAQLNTWMEFTYYPTQSGVLEFAENWVTHGFRPGIFIIDEGWQQRYGVWKFNAAAFPNPREMLNRLHEMGFKVLLWVVPTVSVDGPDFVRSIRPLRGTDPEMAKQLYLRTEDGEIALFKWWNGYSAELDMTNEYNRLFLKRQLDELMELGVDGFKFDGGSVRSFHDLIAVNGRVKTDKTPHELNRAWNLFGMQYPYHEYKDTYGLGGHNMIQRLRDKKQSWSGIGINMLIPSGLDAGLQGYPFICPDMIGGGSWSEKYRPDFVFDEELFIRMAQCSALFPMTQFSWAPWNALSAEGLEICRKMAALHCSLSDRLMKLVREAEQSGEPIMRPLEYNDPHAGFETVTDEFMLGEDLLVCPVIQKGMRERSVRFPAGSWKAEDGTVYPGRTALTLSAPLDTLLWFERV